MSPGAQADFIDAVGLWRLEGGRAGREPIDAATGLLVAGLDSPTLRILAGESPRTSPFVVDDLLQRTLTELGLAHVHNRSPARAALEAMLRRYLAGRIDVRTLSTWAHRAIGHEGDAACQPFVLLDDVRDHWEADGRDPSVLDAAARRQAEAFLSGDPVPGFEHLPCTEEPTAGP